MRKMTILCVIFAVVASACGSAPGGGRQGKTLAVVNGEPLTEATLAKEVENLPPYVRPILETAAGRSQFLESVITRDLLMREALRRGIDRRPEVADRIAMARKSIVLEALMKEVGSGNGEVAADLGEIERGNFVKEFEAAAFAAAPGSVTGPVKTTYGYHVIKVYAKLPAGSRSFEEVKPKLLAERSEQAQRDAFEGLIAGLRKQATVRVLYKPEGPPASPGAPAPDTAPAAPKAALPGK